MQDASYRFHLLFRGCDPHDSAQTQQLFASFVRQHDASSKKIWIMQKQLLRNVIQNEFQEGVGSHSGRNLGVTYSSFRLKSNLFETVGHELFARGVL